MRIYNEIVTIFNENTGLWETISEDSFEYNGPMAFMQGGIPPNASSINTSDTIADTIKTTTGYFTSGDGTLAGDNVFTGSLDTTNEKYYFNVNNLVETDTNTETQFSVTFGHFAGSGSDTYGDSTKNPNTLKGETEVIYKQLSNILQHENEITGGFKISAGGTKSATVSASGADAKDDYVYAIIGKRSRFKDRMNKKAWTLVLSGSNTTGSGVRLSLTDDSKTVASVATPGGPRHNIVSGALGVPVIEAADRTFGWFYPERGIFLFSGHELSASMPGGPHFGAPNLNYSDSETLPAGASGFLSASNGKKFISGSKAGNAITDFTGSINNMYSGAFAHNLDNADEADYGIVIKLDSGSADGGLHQECHIVGINSLEQVITCSQNLSMTEEVGGWSNMVTGSIGQSTTRLTASFSTTHVKRISSSGFAPNLDGKGNTQNALRMVNCMRNMGSTTSLRLRSEEDQTQENYFCRIRAEEYNFTANPSFVSGSKNKLRNLGMAGNPNTFVTGVGLYNSAGQLLAIAELSKPLSKNFASEATIKVKLTY